MPSSADVVFFHALSSLHVGSGSSVDVIDLPLARERATGYPYIPGSAVKGSLRALISASQPEKEEDCLFGYRDRKNAGEDRDTFAGALAPSDARLLFLPVRSFRGVFAFVTASIPLRRLARMLEEANAVDARKLADLKALVKAVAGLAEEESDGTTVAMVAPGCVVAADSRITLEDQEYRKREDPRVQELSNLVKDCILPGEDDYLGSRVCIVPDGAFQNLAQQATEVAARIRIDEKTRTVASGALWNEENLPAETVLVGIIHSFGARDNRSAVNPREALDALWSGEETRIHTFGGKETIGHGRVRLGRLCGKE